MSSAEEWANTSDEVCAAALAGLPSCWAARLRALFGETGAREGLLRLLDHHNDEALRKLLPPRTPFDSLGRWRSALQGKSPAAIEERLKRLGVAVWLREHPLYPLALQDDPEPPLVLFSRGEADALQRRRVAIVGTRRCTAYGRNIAKKLGADLTDAGIGVVSGLAIGIDGAAHDGVLAAGGHPIGVVGSGLDVVYPRRHTSLWNRTASEGLLLSEAALGMSPEPWRFPERNRIIAGLSEALIVVESGEAGGSQITVDAAIARGVDVMAVPGPVGSASSAGTNKLLVEGVFPVLGAAEVLALLGMNTAKQRAEPLRLFEPLSAEATQVLAVLDFVPTPTERIVAEAGLTTGRVMCALEELAAARQAKGGGGWWSRVA